MRGGVGCGVGFGICVVGGIGGGRGGGLYSYQRVCIARVCSTTTHCIATPCHDCRVPRSLAPSSSSSGKKYLAASAIPQPATSQSSEYGFGNNPVPHTYVDRVGAISVVEDPSQVGLEATVFENVDGKRIEDGRYAAFVEEISGFIPEARQVGVVL